MPRPTQAAATQAKRQLAHMFVSQEEIVAAQEERLVQFEEATGQLESNDAHAAENIVEQSEPTQEVEFAGDGDDQDQQPA